MIKRTMYALLHHVEGVDGQSVRVGATVRFVAPHEPDSTVSDNRTESIIVKAICKRDKCVELEHTFSWAHTQFGLLEMPDDAGCPTDHEYKCEHLGHKGQCQRRCFACGGWWNYVSVHHCPEYPSECSECSECSNDEGSMWLSE